MNELADIYRHYLECLNHQAWGNLVNFVHERVRYNNKEIGLDGYRSMLEQNFQDIPDLYFRSELLVANSNYVGCRLQFDCTPIGTFMDLPVNGRRVRFAEHVFYEFQDNKIKEVWSVIDKTSIENKL